VRIRPALEKSPITESRIQERMVQQLPELNKSAGSALQYKRLLSADTYVLRLPTRLPVEEVEKVAARLVGNQDVISAEPDHIRHIATTPDDPRFPDQWDLKPPASGAYGINMPPAWDISTGISSTVVAVVDTGILPNHPDLANRILPGYDFISDAFYANDGNGREADPSDPGDWASAQDFCGYTSNSSWHGSHVAGTIAAATNNTAGIAGINWAAKILPVRVLGKCGGYDSDIIDGIRWAAGLPVQGVPANPNPASVINLSLGGSGACSSLYQGTFNEVTAKGVVVTVAAGNNGADASNFTPANCTGVIAVAASDQNGSRASFSNYGSIVKISAPGVSILSTVSDGTTSPTTYSYKNYNGTSMAAPHISGIVSLMLGVKPNLTPAEVLSHLQANATAFPSGSNCNTTSCGSGIANAAATLKAVAPGVVPPNWPHRNFLPFTSKDYKPGASPSPIPTPVPTSMPTHTPTAAPCRVGGTTTDVVNDASISHTDVTSLASSVSNNQVTATFTLRDLPRTLVFNRTNVPIGAMEYWWGAFYDVDNNPTTGDPRSFYRGADYALVLEYDATGTPPFQAEINSQVFALLYGWTPSINDWWPLNYGTFTTDPNANTIQIAANIPGATNTSRIFFISFDYNPASAGVFDWSDSCVLFTSGASQGASPEPLLR
jgi:serine protease